MKNILIISLVVALFAVIGVSNLDNPEHDHTKDYWRTGSTCQSKI